MEAADVLESLVHAFLAILGAVAGVTIGVSKESAQLFAALSSPSGRQALYDGSPKGPRKIDHGPYTPEPPKSVPTTGTKLFRGVIQAADAAFLQP